MISLCLLFHGNMERALLEGLTTCSLQLEITADTMDEEAALGHAEVRLFYYRIDALRPKLLADETDATLTFLKLFIL